MSGHYFIVLTSEKLFSKYKSNSHDRYTDKVVMKKLRSSGGYRKLRSFRMATIVYDATVSFCERFLDKRSRTVDQMTQAARSGRQNIAEGSRVSAASSQTELRLVSVARGSLDELLLDYEDFLRQRKLRQWEKENIEAREVRGQYKDMTDLSDPTGPNDQSDYKLYAKWLDNPNPDIVANALICLIHQTNFLLDRQIAGLEKQFIQKGGYSETLAQARLRERSKNMNNEGDKPICPKCGGIMVLRDAKKGAHAGSKFWGCAKFPECKGTRESD